MRRPIRVSSLRVGGTGSGNSIGKCKDIPDREFPPTEQLLECMRSRCREGYHLAMTRFKTDAVFVNAVHTIRMMNPKVAEYHLNMGSNTKFVRLYRLMTPVMQKNYDNRKRARLSKRINPVPVFRTEHDPNRPSLW